MKRILFAVLAVGLLAAVSGCHASADVHGNSTSFLNPAQ